MYTRVFQWCTYACSRRDLFLFGFSCYNKDKMTESNLGEEKVCLGLFDLHIWSEFITEGSQATDLLHGLLSLLSCSIGSPAQGWSYPQWAGHLSSIIFKKAPHILSIDNLKEAFLSWVWVSHFSPQRTLACAKWTHNRQGQGPQTKFSGPPVFATLLTQQGALPPRKLTELCTSVY